MLLLDGVPLLALALVGHIFVQADAGHRVIHCARALLDAVHDVLHVGVPLVVLLQVEFRQPLAGGTELVLARACPAAFVLVGFECDVCPAL